MLPVRITQLKVKNPYVEALRTLDHDIAKEREKFVLARKQKKLMELYRLITDLQSRIAMISNSV